MNYGRVNTIAGYHSKLLRRSWVFKMYVVLTFCCTVFLQLFFQSDIVGTCTSPVLASAIPNTVAYLMEMFLIFPVLFSTCSLWFRYRTGDTTDAIYVRPVSNTEFVLGAMWGIFQVFFGINVIFLLTCSMIHLFGASSPFYIGMYLFYLMTLLVPTLVYLLGLSFAVKSWIGNQALSSLILFCYIVLTVLFLRDYKLGIFDPFAWRFPNMISEVVGHPDLQGYLLRRGCWLLVGCGLIGYSMIGFKRLSNIVGIHRMQGVVASLLLLCGLLLGGLAFSFQQERKILRGEYIETYNKYNDRVKLKLISQDILCEQVGECIVGESCMEVKNEESRSLSDVVLYLNPLLKVTSLTCAGNELSFKRENQVIVVSKTLLPGETCELKLGYAGGIDENICYLDVQEDFGERYIYLEDRFTLLIPECLWYPVTVPPVNPESSFHIETNFTNYTLKVVAPRDGMVISPGARTMVEDTIVFKDEHPLPGIFLCIGRYEKAALTVDTIDYELYVFKGHDGGIDRTGNIEKILPAVLSDIKIDIELTKGKRYPFQRFMLVESPLSLSSCYRNERGRSERVQPECVFLPERGNGIIAFQKMCDDKTGVQKVGAAMEEESSIEMLFRSFVYSNFIDEYTRSRLDVKNRFFSTVLGKEIDHFEHEKNMTDISSLFFDYTMFIRSRDFPVIDIVFKMLLRNENTIKFDGLMPISNSGRQEAIRYFAGNSFEMALADKNISPDFFYELLKVKSEDLRNLMMLAGVSSDDFKEFLFGFMERNAFREVEFSRLNEECIEILGIDLERMLSSWYRTSQVPKFIIRDFVTRWIKNSPDDQGPGRDSKMQVQFRTYNSSEVDGVVSFFSEYYDVSQSGDASPGNKKLLQKNFLVEAGVGKEITFVTDQLLTTGAINTNISGNLPNEIRYSLYPFSSTLDTTESITTLDSSFFYSSSDEIIVDNEDPGFHVFDVEKRNKWFLRSDHSSMKCGNKSIMGVYIPEWTYFIDAGYYGNHIRSGISKTAGKGDAQVEWCVKLPQSGEYEVFAYIYQAVSVRVLGSTERYQVGGKTIDVGRTGNVVAADAIPKQYYTVCHDEGEEEIVIETKGISGWVSLGRFNFSAGEYKVTLSDKGELNQEIEADAMKWVRCD